ncbi:hypothetical protein [Acinetobacter guerrae]|uniref:hypothetical protein n=1 Tax=Acinetobacter guerrae TaxID=1843371 RepID=UPI00125EB6C4|nr:hypothetical protein [Acinetobacter guerrae]
MNAHKFVADFGIARARAVLDGAPITYTGTDTAQLCYRAKDNKYSLRFKPSIELVNVSSLKKVVESVGVIEKQEGLIKARKFLDYLISYGSEFGHVSKDEVLDLKQAIEDYEAVESCKENQHV